MVGEPTGWDDVVPPGDRSGLSVEYLNASSRLSCAAQIPRLPLTHLVLDYQFDPQWLHLPLQVLSFLGTADGAILNRLQAHLLAHVGKLRGDGRGARTRASLDCRVSPALLPGPLTSPVNPDKAKREHQGGYRAQHLGRPQHGLLARSRR